MTRNMTTYANIKLAEIYALYGNPFTRGNCKKNFKQKLKFSQNNKINFQETVNDLRLNYANLKQHFNGTLFPFKMNLIDNLNLNNNFNNILEIKKISEKYNNSNGSFLSNKKKSNNILSLAGFVKIEKNRSEDIKISKKNETLSSKMNITSKMKVNLLKENNKMFLAKKDESIEPTKEPIENIISKFD